MVKCKHKLMYELHGVISFCPDCREVSIRKDTVHDDLIVALNWALNKVATRCQDVNTIDYNKAEATLARARGTTT